MEPGLKQFESGKFRPAPGEKIKKTTDEINKRLELGKKEGKAPIYHLDDYRKDISPAKRGLSAIDNNDRIRMALDLARAKEELASKEKYKERLLEQMGKMDLYSESRKFCSDKIQSLGEEIEELRDEISLQEK